MLKKLLIICVFLSILVSCNLVFLGCCNDYVDVSNYSDDEDYDDDGWEKLELGDAGNSEELENEIQGSAPNDRDNRLKNKMEEVKAQLAIAKKEADERKKVWEAQRGKRVGEEQKRKEIAKGIVSLQDQVSLLEKQQVLLEKDIVKSQRALALQQKKRAEELTLLEKRFKSDYLCTGTQNAEVLEILFGQKTYFEVLTHADFVKRVMSKNRNLIKEIKRQEAQMEKDKVALELKKAELLATKKEIEEKKKRLDVEYNVTERQICASKLHEQLLLEKYEECMKQEKEYQKEISRILSQLESFGEKYVGGELCWPVPGFYMISSPFGYRTFQGRKEFHGGIDIAGAKIYGKNVVAANDGKVVYVSYADTKGYGSYGKYVIVDHGGGFTTLYAHLSSICVNQGTVIVKGKKLGEVGSTGYSTGPHLHFEVRLNGDRKNPMSFFKNEKKKENTEKFEDD